MLIFKFENIKILRVEITTVCNARCNSCARKELTRYQHMTQDVWSNIISEENLKHVEQIYFNGNYGDFSCHPNSLDFLNQISNKNIEIVISTNGSTHQEKYWSALANILKKFQNHKVIFAIDGASEETHSSYRENTKFSLILENAKSFISNGGNASWQFVTFQENQHEIETAFNLSKNLEFKEFFLINSYSSTITNSQGRQLTQLDSIIYFKYFIKYKFEIPTIRQIEQGHMSSCPWTRLSRIQINVDGSVWPCCWVGTTYNVLGLNNTCTLENSSLKEIIESDFYQIDVTNKINDTNSYCYSRCPVKYKDLKIFYRKP